MVRFSNQVATSWLLERTIAPSAFDRHGRSTLGAGAVSRRSGETARPRASIRRGGLEKKSAQGQNRKTSRRAYVFRFSPQSSHPRLPVTNSKKLPCGDPC